MTSHIVLVAETKNIGVKSVGNAAMSGFWQNRRASPNVPEIDIIAQNKKGKMQRRLGSAEDARDRLDIARTKRRILHHNPHGLRERDPVQVEAVRVERNIWRSAAPSK